MKTFSNRNPPRDWFDHHIRRGIRLAGIDPLRAVVVTDDFEDWSWWTRTGTWAGLAKAGGILRITATTDTYGSRQSSVAADALIVSDGQPWVHVARFKIAGTSGAGSYGGLGHWGAGFQGFFVGQDHAVSGTKYVAWSQQGGVHSGVASDVTMDTGWHTLRLIWTGSVYRFAVDEETPKTLTSNVTTGTLLWPGVNTVPNGVNRDYQFDSGLWITQREAA